MYGIDLDAGMTRLHYEMITLLVKNDGSAKTIKAIHANEDYSAQLKMEMTVYAQKCAFCK